VKTAITSAYYNIILIIQLCVSEDAEWHGCLCVVSAGFTDAGHNSTLPNLPTVYTSHKTLKAIAKAFTKSFHQTIFYLKL